MAESPRAASIRLEGIQKRYPNGTEAVRDLSLDVRAGELVVLIGPSGCGKSTVLRMINRLIEPTAGRILLGDEDVTDVDPVRLRRRIGYVIQNVGLFPHQTVRANVATVPRPAPLAQGPDPGTGRRAARPGRAGPGRVRRSLPARAVGRPAAAGRGGPGARRRPGGAADGRAVLGRRPDRAGPPPGGVPPPPGRGAQDDRAGHPRPRRGRPARRPDRGALRGRAPGAVRHAGRVARRTRHRRSCASSSAPTGASAGWRSPRSTGRRSNRYPGTPRRTCRPSRWTAPRTTRWRSLLTSGRDRLVVTDGGRPVGALSRQRLLDLGRPAH